MKKIMLVVVAMALVSLVGCKDEGSEFVGVWKNAAKTPETITIAKNGSGYRAIAQLDEDKKGYMNVEAELIVAPPTDSARELVRKTDYKRAIALKDGKLTSYLRHGTDDTFTKVN